MLLEKRVATLEAARRVVPGWSPKTLPPRPCVLFTEHITRDEEMDFVMKKLHRQHEDKIRDFGNQIFGAFLAMEELMAGTPTCMTGCSLWWRRPMPVTLPSPAGTTSPFYQGPYEQNRAVVQQLLAYAREAGLVLTGRPFELYEIDNRDTVRPEEFLTEVQVGGAGGEERPGRGLSNDLEFAILNLIMPTHSQSGRESKRGGTPHA